MLVLAVAISGLVIVRPGPVAGWLGDRPAGRTAVVVPPEPTPGPVLAGAAVDAPTPAAARVQAALDKVIAGSPVSGARVAVVDIVTGQSVYSREAETPTVPASTTKLLTAAAVLAARGDAHRIPTRVVAGAAPGEVVIVGGGDPTLAADANGYYAGAGRLDQLAEQVKSALGGTVPTKVTVDSSLYSGPVHEPGWDPDIPGSTFAASTTALMTDGARIDPADEKSPRYTSPDIAAGRAFAKELGLPTDAVKAVSRGAAPPAVGGQSGAPTSGGSAAAPVAGAAVTPGTELGRVLSPPMVRLVEFMLNESDNVVAEALARQVALARNQPASFTGGAAATRAVLGELGLPVDRIELADGSGLSRKNKIPPSVLVQVLTLAANGSRPELAALFNGLPVAAWSGTLQERFRSPAVQNEPGAGVVRAKTGTLSGVNALSGVVTTADGRLLAFAALADGVSAAAEVAQPALDRIPATLAACGCR
ncbi:D-alanyl-D-alanine carboxypeptidase / D-alanyl-D-alanine-endopeptidase (penicillin-binding protein 4) [Micromonospora pattaloongensis]|uniref:D-alanyl-D-alanine carboxypeptidase / D-alanyl-D-alanine-endopeptidase (Penicillin-binding protein 4) n=1 Tax=Micromonospora pattaloongensis TaxID=405436 RepID=A0A1H3HAW1_9ACTN|nr:D-alanyl-D-alanine carboxypeptidase / D-alanyl-D-alanine-endopeptidase (penicillin-binding protein 4) [Micromonospora pattaloongensis]